MSTRCRQQMANLLFYLLLNVPIPASGARWWSKPPLKLKPECDEEVFNCIRDAQKKRQRL